MPSEPVENSSEKNSFHLDDAIAYLVHREAWREACEPFATIPVRLAESRMTRYEETIARLNVHLDQGVVHCATCQCFRG